ncbi:MULTISPECIES: prenyltransferase [unclassified Fusibacter]|uniref:prenyltransferase n=1 Tax=unclassified Fusibacter TaxID=2624464 RepID=UPI001013B8B8|nr:MULTISPECIES: prenyltransferase [unclassified Fusibacter]MCK8058972.1 prenyltransferase [Fusibacter sp. A2]NPE22383.1 prenyltransferase [Fusibacter sp. A1]RXV60489.1 prenyltransferase [Fusibacter sp. A1]
MTTLIRYIKEYIIALRVFSLTLALAATTFGMISAYRAGSFNTSTPLFNVFLVIIITIAGVASQAGANLINDYFEGSFKYRDYSKTKVMFLGKERSYFDLLVFLSGLAALGLAGLIGLYLIYITDWWMLAIGLVGLIGSYAYTGEPFVYKTKGLGVPLSFVLMGPLMLIGASYPFMKTISLYPVVIGLPVSLFVPALMISNEMRDFKRDKRLAMGTLSVLLGPKKSLMLYDVLVFGAFVLTLLYILLGIYPVQTLLVFISFPTALKARGCVKRFERLSIPYTNRLHLMYFTVVTICLLLF